MIPLAAGQYRFDFNSGHQYRADAFTLRRYIKRECFKPITRRLLDANVMQHVLAASAEQESRASALVNLLVRALQAGIRPQKIYEGGSFKKNTNLGYHHDVDLVLFLNDFDFRKMEEYKALCCQVLTNAFPNLQDEYGSPQVWYKRSTPYCQKLSFRMLDVDLVITGDPHQNCYDNPPASYHGACSLQNDDEILNAKAQYGNALHYLIILCKHWKRQYQWTQRGPASYYIELLCIRTFATAEPPPRDIETAFRLFLERIMRGDIQAWNARNIEYKPPREDQQAFIEYASRTHRHVWFSR